MRAGNSDRDLDMIDFIACRRRVSQGSEPAAGRLMPGRLAWLTVVFVLIAALPLARAGVSSDGPIVFTQLPTAKPPSDQCDGLLRSDYGEGGRVVRLEPDGRLVTLTEGFSSACGADVSFDGRRILFAAKRASGDPWNIWEMNADGSAPRQITRDQGNCRSPAYQATLYTIVSTEPWYQVMFVSDAANELNEYGCGSASSLYSCRLDGGGVRRLTMNLSDDLDPFLMDDGRVLLASWQRAGLGRGLSGRIALFGVNTDGTDYALYCGNQERRIRHMPCQTTDGLVVFVEADRVGWDGAGQLALVAVRRPHYSYRPVTDDSDLLYHSPSPLPGGGVLVSRRRADASANHGIYRLDPRAGRAELLFDDPNYHDVHAKALVARPEPDGRSSVVKDQLATGKFYCLNAYLGDATVQSHLRPGMIRRVRVLEGVPRSTSDPVAPAPNGVPPVVQKRVLGNFAIEEDGSFHVKLPADLPVQFQTLDDNGMALRSCAWVWCKPNEPRGCIGCHEDPELTPENRFADAVRKPAVDLTGPVENGRTVDFRRDVMSIIEAKCATCHQDDAHPPILSDATGERGKKAYTALLCDEEENGAQRSVFSPVLGRYVHPGQARTSPLIWRLYGRNTSRPWDSDFDPARKVGRCPPPGAPLLTDDEKRTFVEWIDLGAQWDGIPGPDAFNRGEDAP